MAFESLNDYIQFFIKDLSSLIAVLSVPDGVAEKLDPSEDSSGPSYIDYSERRSLPISIPDYQTVEKDGERFVVRAPRLIPLLHAFPPCRHNSPPTPTHKTRPSTERFKRSIVV